MGLKSIKNWYYSITGNRYAKFPMDIDYSNEPTDKEIAEIHKIAEKNGWDIESLKAKGFKQVGKSAW